MSEVSLYGVRPTTRFGAWLSLLPQNGKELHPALPFALLKGNRRVGLRFGVIVSSAEVAFASGTAL
jgi:hypothetical protein